MSIKLTGSILADHLEGLRAKASPGPWETDTIDGDGFKSAAIYAGRHATAKVILDSLNSEDATLEEDFADDGHAETFDRQAIDNVAFVKALENNLPTILEALRRQDSAPVDEIRTAADPFVRALAILDSLPDGYKPDEATPLRDAIPGGWPTIAELRALVVAIAGAEIRDRVRAQIAKIPPKS